VDCVAGGIQFILKFWERLYKTLDTHLNFSFAYHPQTDGQTIIAIIWLDQKVGHEQDGLKR
jgi:hypothetical protein